MFVFNEGVPRSGKSYDCVKHHIIPALKKGRHVWARINGAGDDACRREMAKLLGMPLERLDEIYHHVETKDVVEKFKCFRDPGTGEWLIEEHFKNALIVIDEVHEFYVKSRKELDGATESFFALLGQNGGDGIIMTQWIDRTHTAIKARIEKKNSFQKLQAAGMKGKYLVTYYQTIAAGKFQKIGSATKDYDPTIFPVYKGYADGVTNTEAYSEGSTNVWKSMIFRGVIFGTLGLVGVWFLLSFFRGDGSDLFTGDKAATMNAGQGEHRVVEEWRDPAAGAYAPPQSSRPQPVVEPDPFEDLSQEQRYVAELAKGARPRVAARAEIGGRELAQIEWVDATNVTLEALSLVDLEAMGYAVEGKSYGFRLIAGDHVIVATPWPRQRPQRDPDAKLYNTSGSSESAGGLVSVANEAAGGGASGGAVIKFPGGYAGGALHQGKR